MNKSGTNVTKIQGNSHYNGSAGSSGQTLSVNNFYWSSDFSGSVKINVYFGRDEDRAHRMTKDTSITTPDRMTKDTSITQPKPSRMTKDTSITDRAPGRENEKGNSQAGIVNNFYQSNGFSGCVENNFYFGKEAAAPSGNSSRPSRAANPGQSNQDPAELPGVPNVDHQHIK